MRKYAAQPLCPTDLKGGSFKMDSRERILVALENREPDKVPVFELQIDEPIVIKLAALLGFYKPPPGSVGAFVHGDESQEVLDLYCRLVEELGLDATCFVFSAGIKPIGEGKGRDKYGCVYKLSELGEPIVIEGPITTLDDLKGYDIVSRLSLDDFEQIRYVSGRLGKHKAHFLALNDPFKISWMLRGDMANLMMDYVWRPELAHAVGRITTDLCLAEIDMGCRLGVDGIVVEGDLAGEQTLLISPKHYRTYVKPYEKEVVGYAHRRGLKAVKHTDGNVWPILDDLIEIGFDAFNPIQPQCMDIGEVKKHAAGRMCLIGNIDCRNLLPYGTPEEVEETVRRTIEVAGPGGGYIISSSNSVHAACKPENYLAMVRAAQRYGSYT